MSYALQQAALAVLVGSAANAPVYWEGQGKPRPPYPYISLNLITSAEVGFGDIRRKRETVAVGSEQVEKLRVSIRHDEEITVSINTHTNATGDHDVSALAYMRRIRHALGRPSSLRLLRDAGLSVASLGETRNLNGLGNGGELQRTQMDVQFNTAIFDRPADELEDIIRRIEATLKFQSPTNERESELVVDLGE